MLKCGSASYFAVCFLVAVSTGSIATPEEPDMSTRVCAVGEFTRSVHIKHAN